MVEKVDAKQLAREAKQLSYWQRHRFLLMVGSAIVLALFMVMIAMNLYRSSGAAQLDLSRPGYEAVRDQVGRDSEMTAFPQTGELTPAALDEFDRIYTESLDELSEVDAFAPGALSDSALELPNIMR